MEAKNVSQEFSQTTSGQRNKNDSGFNPVQIFSDDSGYEVLDMVVDDDPESQGFIIDRLTFLYSKPIVATVRELVSNAFDSMTRDVNGRFPHCVEVTTPTEENPVLVVQDYGCGMSRDDIREIYRKFGRSSKFMDASKTGSYGLGAKTPLAYCDEFSVESVRDGMKTSFVVSKKNVGKSLQIFDSVFTDEPNGTRVTIPVASGDFKDFKEAVNNYRTFSQDWPVSIDGNLSGRNIHANRMYDVVLDEKRGITGTVYAKSRFFNTNMVHTSGPYNALYAPNGFNVEKFSIMISGWVYKNPFSEYSSSDYILEIKPDVLNFTSSRDNVVPDEKAKSVLQNVIDQMMEMSTKDLSDPLDTLVRNMSIEDFYRLLVMNSRNAVKRVSLSRKNKDIEVSLYANSANVATCSVPSDVVENFGNVHLKDIMGEGVFPKNVKWINTNTSYNSKPRSPQTLSSTVITSDYYGLSVSEGSVEGKAGYFANRYKEKQNEPQDNNCTLSQALMFLSSDTSAKKVLVIENSSIGFASDYSKAPLYFNKAIVEQLGNEVYLRGKSFVLVDGSVSDIEVEFLETLLDMEIKIVSAVAVQESAAELQEQQRKKNISARKNIPVVSANVLSIFSKNFVNENSVKDLSKISSISISSAEDNVVGTVSELANSNRDDFVLIVGDVGESQNYSMNVSLCNAVANAVYSGWSLDDNDFYFVNCHGMSAKDIKEISTMKKVSIANSFSHRSQVAQKMLNNPKTVFPVYGNGDSYYTSLVCDYSTREEVVSMFLHKKNVTDLYSHTAVEILNNMEASSVDDSVMKSCSFKNSLIQYFGFYDSLKFDWVFISHLNVQELEKRLFDIISHEDLKKLSKISNTVIFGLNLEYTDEEKDIFDMIHTRLSNKKKFDSDFEKELFTLFVKKGLKIMDEDLNI